MSDANGPEGVSIESVVEQGPDAVIFADRDGVIRIWNAAAERIFGQTREQAIGQRLDLIVPERFRDQHWEGYERALGDGETKYAGQSLPTRALRGGGEQFYVELSFAIVRGDGGEVVGALATARDITERFEQERTNRRRLEELETALKEREDSGS
ncbi:MAG TPA: PAS domain S-box protein [Dehalococcoidia bacterium]|nr:PAS domain S-box protein [Dehalococcoidia bacterium]